MAGIGAAKWERLGDVAAIEPVARESLSSAMSNSACAKASIEVVAAGASRRQVRHSGPVAGVSGPPIGQVPSSQQAIRTTHWQPWRSAVAAASGRTAVAAKKARRSAARACLRRCIEWGL